MTRLTGRGDTASYNFAYLDEQTKRMIRRAILKAIAIPGYQVPFASREMPMPYGWGTGGVQVTAAIIGPTTVLKVIDQGADDTTNAVSIRVLPKTAGVARRRPHARRDDHPDPPPHSRNAADRRPGAGLPGADPRAAALSRAARDRDPQDARARGIRPHACEALRGHRPHGHIATTYAYPVKVEGRYVMDPSPTPKFDNPKMDMSPALQLFGAGREKRIYAIPPHTAWSASISRITPSRSSSFEEPCALCGAENVYLDEVLDDKGGRMFVCSDTDHCEERLAEGHKGGLLPKMPMPQRRPAQ
jgi:alpha-D-ribose 1-methylphosphonate 5-phosphate C-P lyase